MSKPMHWIVAAAAGAAAGAIVTWNVAKDGPNAAPTMREHAAGDHEHSHAADGTHTHARSWRDDARLNDPDLPDWARRAAQRHGGLGPWVISGAIAARDARAALKPAAGEVLEVVYLVPDDRRVPGVMCVMDGLSVGSGSGGSDHDVRAVYSESLDPKYEPPPHAEPGVPTLFRVLNEDGEVVRAVRYTPSSTLLTLLHEGSLDSLAADARRLIKMRAEDLFVVDVINREIAAAVP